MKRLRVWFLGAGKMNARHVGFLRGLRPDAFVGVASRDEARARAYAAAVKADGWCAGYEAAIADAGAGPDAEGVVVIGTPPSTHRALLEQALAAGKHCLVEKPVVNHLDELAGLWPALTRSRAVVMVAENLHYAPFQRRLRAALVEGKGQGWGRPLALDLVRFGRARVAGWRSDPAEMPLGALHEGGVHWIRRLLDLAAAVEGDPLGGVEEVMAYSPGFAATGVPGEDTMMVLARHRSGLTSRLFHSWAVPWRFPLFDASKALFEAGALYFDARGLYGRAYAPDGQRWLLPSLRDAGGYRAMWRDFVGAIAEGRPPQLSLDHVFADFAYLDAAYRSLRSGRPEVPRRPGAAGRASG